ncbi:hypothetical protein AALP_AAs56572U000100 [Arabis alpina]|uniref:Uncharacterized protein n=1 Tax=Arabis alpina TaxID=50452 RepID=A0A087G2K5_ARAAL|nr:hypothetical protein AALP_AAs56572U000100 [Arabis alpina]
MLKAATKGGNNRKKTITASILSLSLFVILGSAAFGFWRYRVRHNGEATRWERNCRKTAF